MKKTPTAPANQAGGNEPETAEVVFRQIRFTKTRWDDIRQKFGNGTRLINRLLDKEGIAE